MTPILKSTLLLSAALLAACAGAPQRAQPESAAAPISCTVLQPAPSAQQAAESAELQRRVASEKLFAVPAAAGLASCTVQYTAGATQLEYRFDHGGWLTIKRDPRIEYSEQSARFALPPSADPVAILDDAEHHAFGAQGCGIDWRHGSAEPAENAADGTDTVFHGNVCNCQARMRRLPQSDIVWLVLRSAC